MASRISHKACRNSRSFSRLMVTRAMGTARKVRTIKMVVATINSIKVKPRISRCSEKGFEKAVIGLVDVHRSRSSSHQRGLHIGVARSSLGNGKGGLSGGFRHEGQSYDRSLPGNAGGAGRPGSGDLKSAAGIVVAMNQRHRLTVLGEEGAVRDIDHLQHLGIVGDL